MIVKLFIFIFTLNTFYFFFKQRKFDLFTIFFLSSAFYSMPLFFGTLYNPFNYVEYNIAKEVYLFYLFYYFIILLFVYSYDKIILPKLGNFELPYLKNLNKYYFILVSILFILFIYFFIKDPTFLFSQKTSKANFGEFGVLAALFTWGSLILYSLSLFLNNKKIYIPLFFIFLTFFGGSRAYILTAILMYFIFLFLFKKPKIRLIKQYKYIFMGIFILSFFITYKLVFNYIRLFDLHMILITLTNPQQYLFRIFQGGENFQTMVSLQHAIVDLTHPNITYLHNFILKLVPFFSQNIAYAFDINLETMNNILRDTFYYNVSYGVASSFWGEMIYTFGMFGVYIILIIFLFLIGIFNYSLQKNIKIIYIFLFPSITYIIFYIHRNDFNFGIYSLYITTAFYCLIFVIKNLLFSIKKGEK
jgi:hypothetical protein